MWISSRSELRQQQHRAWLVLVLAVVVCWMCQDAHVVLAGGRVFNTTSIRCGNITNMMQLHGYMT